MWRDEEWYTALSHSDKVAAYESGERYLERVLSYDVSARLKASINQMRIKDFLDVKLDLDYEPFTGKVKWHRTGLISVHGKWKIDWNNNYRQIIHTNKKKRLTVDPEFYTFDLIRYAYENSDMTVEEYLENTRRKAKYVREEN